MTGKRGRPKGSTLEPVTLRLDRDIVAGFREKGPGYQTRMRQALDWSAKAADLIADAEKLSEAYRGLEESK